MAPSKKIMVVDDSNIIRMSLKNEISAYGYDVFSLDSGKQCLDYFQGNTCDLVLLDINMPNMDGFETLKLLRLNSDPLVTNIPVILLTSSEKIEDQIKGFEFGANDFLQKENTLTEVIKSIDLLLNPPKEYEGFTALVVEDDMIFRRGTVGALISEGFNVLEADNGKDAFELFKKHEDEIDLVVTDDLMPKMSGLELTQAIRGHTSKKVLILCISGANDEKKIHQFIKSKANDYLHKPVTLELFKTKIFNLMRSYLFGKVMGTHPISKFKEISRRQQRSTSGQKSDIISTFLIELDNSNEKIRKAVTLANQFVKEIEKGQKMVTNKDEINKVFVSEVEEKQQKLTDSTDILMRMIKEIETYQDEIVSAKDIFNNIYQTLLKLNNIMEEENIVISNNEFNSTLKILINNLDVLKKEFGDTPA